MIICEACCRLSLIQPADSTRQRDASQPSQRRFLAQLKPGKAKRITNTLKDQLLDLARRYLPQDPSATVLGPST
ncbi:hypothetical protein O9929_14960 [Vibrio lentus]|nr:hypothetical protein [Vibrio lentus]